MSLFTPVTGLIGGSLIGLSAATLLLFNGDILGASGLMSSFVVNPKKTLIDPSQQWKLAFLAAFCLMTRVYVTMIDPNALTDERLGYTSGLPIVSPWVIYITSLIILTWYFFLWQYIIHTDIIICSMGFILGGFCVGFGTRLGNGCTTGHGICGMARLSKRSLVGVLTFMATGVLSATSCSKTCPLHPFLRDRWVKISLCDRWHIVQNLLQYKLIIAIVNT